MAAFHEEISSNLTLLDQRQGKEVERLAKKYRSAVETVVSTMADCVDKSREDFEAKAVSLQTLLQSGQQHAQVWLNQIQQAAARREEREASSQYCQQARTLWDQAYKHETEITSKMREVMVIFIQCQSAAVGKLDLSLEAHSRTMKAVDCAAGRMRSAYHLLMHACHTAMRKHARRLSARQIKIGFKISNLTNDKLLLLLLSNRSDRMIKRMSRERDPRDSELGVTWALFRLIILLSSSSSRNIAKLWGRRQCVAPSTKA